MINPSVGNSRLPAVGWRTWADPDADAWPTPGDPDPSDQLAELEWQWSGRCDERHEKCTPRTHGISVAQGRCAGGRRSVLGPRANACGRKVWGRGVTRTSDIVTGGGVGTGATRL